MTRILAIAAAALVCLASGGATRLAQAGPVINVDFDNPTNNPSDDGMNPTPYSSTAAPLYYTGSTWNDFPSAGSGGPLSLVDSNNNATTASLSWSNGSGSSDYNPGTLPLLTEAIYVGGLIGTMTISNLSNTQEYNLYIASEWKGCCGGTFSVNGSTTETSSGAQGTSWVAGTNYVEFKDVFPSSGQLIVSYTQVGGLGILNGFQLQAIPEPSTFVLGGVGVLGVSVAVRRRRRV